MKIPSIRDTIPWIKTIKPYFSNPIPLVIKDIEKIESKEAKASPPNICKKFIISLSVNKYFIFFIIDYILLLKSTKNLEFFTNLISPVAINISTRIFL